jgi:uncharacterized membrane protein YgcG
MRRPVRPACPPPRSARRYRPVRAASRVGVLAIALHALLVLVALAAAPVLAAEPPEIEGPITDQAEVMSPDEESSALPSVERLREETGVQLFSVFVDTTEDLSLDEFVDETIERNGLGPSDALLLVAVEDRQYRVNIDGSLMSPAEVDELARTATEPALSDGNWAGAIVATADGLTTELAAPGPSQAPPPGPGPVPEPTPDGGIPGLFILAGLIFGAVVLLIGLRWAVGGRLRARSGEERDVQTGDLARRANVLLVQTDDLVRDAEQEVSFAEAQFGADAQPYRAALEASRADLKEAFHARQLLDDEQPDDESTRRRLLTQIIERAEAATRRLTEQAEAFERLRAIERNGPAILASLPAEIAKLEARLPAVRATRDALDVYAESDRASVAGNLPEAEKRIAYLKRVVAEANAPTFGSTGGSSPGTASTGGDSPGRRARLAQGALAGATDLLDQIDRLAASLESARGQAETEMAAAEQDLAIAATEVHEGAVGADVTGRMAEARSLLESARNALAGPRPAVLTALRVAQQANRIGDEILAGIRTERDRRARAAAALETAVRAAQTSVTLASDFIANRRNGVRHEARTRLAEAERHLAMAMELGPADPPRATGEAQAAQRLADEALRLAQADFHLWDSGGVAGGGRRGSDGELIGAILGGMLGGWLGAGRGGFGGSPWGTGSGGSPPGGSWGDLLGGGGGRSRGGGGFGLGGFGGGGGRSSGGGRF